MLKHKQKQHVHRMKEEPDCSQDEHLEGESLRNHRQRPEVKKIDETIKTRRE